MELPTFMAPTIETENLPPVSPSKRKRLTQACDACRKKKVKCSGDKPSCNNCTRLGTTCTYLPSSRKRGPRVGLVESLEKRLQQMEKLLQPLKEQGIVDAEDKKPVKKIRLDSKNSDIKDSDIPNNPYTPNIFNNNSNKQPQQQSLEQTEFIHVFSQPPQVEQPPTQREQNINEDISNDLPKDNLFFGNSSADPGYHDPNHCKFEVLDENDEHSSPSESNNSADDTPITSPITSVIKNNNGLPPEEIVLHLAACYFRHIDIQMPMFHEATFMRRLRQNKVSPFLVYAICAASARYAKLPSIVQKPPFKSGDPFAAIAINHYFSETLDNPNVERVQGLVLLTLYMYGAGAGPKAWMFTGMAVRMAQELGLHKVDVARSKSSKSSEGFFIQQEIRRRTFWSCFLLDRFTACALGHPTLIDEEDCDVRLPCHEKLWNSEHPLESPFIDEFFKEEQIKHDVRLTPTTFGMSASYVSAAILLGRICQHVNRSGALPPWDPNSQFSALEIELDTWYKSLSLNHNYTKEKMHQLMSNGLGTTFATIYLLYYAALVVLNRTNKINPPQNDDVAKYHIDIMRGNCSRAAKCISSIAADMTQYGNEFFCLLSLYPVYITTQVHLADVYNLDIEIAEDAKKWLEKNEQFLKELGSYWAMAAKLLYFVRGARKQADDRYNLSSYKEHGSEQGGEMVLSLDGGVKPQWNRVYNNNGFESNFENLPPIVFPEQLFSPNIFYDMGDSLTSFLRSPGPLSPSLLRLTKKENDNSDQDDSSLEYDYFSQNFTAYNNNSIIQAPPAFVYDGNSMMDLSSDWSGTLSRPIKNWTNINGSIINSAIDDTLSISTSTNITPSLVTTSSTGDVNIDPLLI